MKAQSRCERLCAFAFWPWDGDGMVVNCLFLSYSYVTNKTSDMESTEATIWYPSHLDQYLNRWFARYEEAKKSLDQEGGYLFPYKQQFFVCEWGAVRAMGLDPKDPDWEKIGFDCARPADPEAYKRLVEKRKAADKKS